MLICLTAIQYFQTLTFLRSNKLNLNYLIICEKIQLLLHLQVIINGVRVVQTDSGDVTVESGQVRFLRMRPNQSVLRVKTQFVEVDIEANWQVKVTRGAHAFNVTKLGMIVTNGRIKASIDKAGNFRAFSLPEHGTLLLGQCVPRRKSTDLRKALARKLILEDQLK